MKLPVCRVLSVCGAERNPQWCWSQCAEGPSTFTFISEVVAGELAGLEQMETLLPSQNQLLGSDNNSVPDGLWGVCGLFLSAGRLHFREKVVFFLNNFYIKERKSNISKTTSTCLVFIYLPLPPAQKSRDLIVSFLFAQTKVLLSSLRQTFFLFCWTNSSHIHRFEQIEWPKSNRRMTIHIWHLTGLWSAVGASTNSEWPKWPTTPPPPIQHGTGKEPK